MAAACPHRTPVETPLTSTHSAVFGSRHPSFHKSPIVAGERPVRKTRVIPGVLWDSAGKDLTRDQVAAVPGAIPTVTVGDVSSGKAGAGAGPAVAALPLVQKAYFGTVGAASAPHLWMVIDPQCVYSLRAYQMLRPFVEAGKLQLSIIPISVLDYEDNGQTLGFDAEMGTGLLEGGLQSPA
jgi:hypothetical protein